VRKSERSFSWLRRSLLLSPATDEPLVLPGSVQAVVDLFGTARYNESIDNTFPGVAAATLVQTPVVPDGFVDCVIAASCFHNDVVARSLTLSIIRQTVTSAIANTLVAVAANVRLASPRAFYLPPGVSIAAEADAMGVGAFMRINWHTIRVELGETPRLL